ncbi:hypothetical protein BGZ61DRAFT_359899 [Ilyonectria robusta]|uniref:uncharacterized protein n=1 Tax=Ilyonectria robusta TaxID=1079257 RepID=UPI001E8CF343|nr:uncharacterized protein BGZ61DRAFT_359899 [Ilyonectria robusta]KAH8679160.1 hypothetical protein BGZ61DRAFT_359899 [Ilyonectria robusta]
MAAWEALPEKEHISVWNETERNFWLDQERQHEAADIEADKAYQSIITDAKVELSNLTGRRSLLSESQARLVRELAKVEEELSRVSQACDEKAERLNGTEQEYRDGQQARLETRQKVRKTMRRFFKERRGEDPNVEDPEDIELERLAPAPETAPAPQPRINGTAPSEADEPRERVETPVEDTSMEDVEQQQNGDHPYRSKPYDKTGLDVIVEVVDADGNVIGPVERIEPWNQWVEAIQDLEIRRPVKIRRGRRFNDSHLSTIYERTEAKGVKWLSCMIQATGEIQTKRCQSCDKNQGAFDDCIIVGGDLFQKCGNCEWNRQGCHGASGDVIDVPTARRRYRQRRDTGSLQNSPTQREPPQVVDIQPRPEPEPEPESEPEPVHHFERQPLPQPHHAPLPSNHALHAPHHAPHHHVIAPLPVLAPQPREPDRAQPSTEVDTPIKDMPILNGSQIVREPEQMPTPQEYRVTPGFTPANTRSRPPSADRPTPTSMHIEPSPQPTESFSEEPLEEITRENLVLRDNGVVYTYPECVQGVPLQKIDERHPYWEPNWPNVRTLIEPQLAKWREKHQAAIEAGPKQEKGGSSKYQIGRQVNRGIKILEFLEEGDISPYQLLGKKFIQSGKGGICSYDTLFRLSETMSELAKFKLDMKPVEWMRHRLYELSISEGASFNLPRTIHDFYHDPKLTALRYKHGFKNIGRPSGMKTGRHSLGSPNSTPKPLKKRKSMHSLASTPRETPYVDQSPLATQMSLPPENPFGSHLQKRPKLLSPAPMPIHDEFQVAGHSDADSWSGVPVGRKDYRLYQVKTRLYTSSTHVTQYWSWMDEDQSFEHQVLKGLNPVSWGVHKDPIDFHVNLEEISQVVWNIEALRIHIFMRPEGSVLAKKDGQLRGDIMAAFKRERTMRRFLNFCREKGVQMLKASTEELDHRWLNMHSEQLPDENGKPTKELMA